MVPKSNPQCLLPGSHMAAELAWEPEPPLLDSTRPGPACMLVISLLVVPGRDSCPLGLLTACTKGSQATCRQVQRQSAACCPVLLSFKVSKLNHNLLVRT